MQPSDPVLYLDPLLPLHVRARPGSIPRVVGSTVAAAVVLCAHGSYRVGRAGTVAGSSVLTGPWLLAATTTDSTVLRAAPGTLGRLLVMGRRLLDELAVSAFGEPGFCRFLDGLSRPGVTLGGAFDANLPALVDALVAELGERPPAYRLRARSLLTDLLLSVYRAIITTNEPALSDGHHLASVIDFIEMNYAERLSLEELAAMMGTSPTHFSRVFRRETGVPLFEFINRTRIRRACGLLRRTDLPITRIAIDVGYNNVSFFNRYFRRVMRLSPREYRRSVTR